jgi:biotin carboxyl carrier protein
MAKYITTVEGKQFVIDINREGRVTVDGEEINANMLQMLDSTMYSMLIDSKSHDIRMMEGDGVYEVELSGEIYEVMVEDERTRRLAGLKGTGATSGELVIKAPMPGVIVEIPITVGQHVEKGDILLILESMKMQNEFKSPRAGKIKTIRVSAKEKVDQNAVLIVIGDDTEEQELTIPVQHGNEE